MAFSSVRIGTYNILNPYYALKWSTLPGYNIIDGQKVDNWNDRKLKVAAEINKSDCDLVCLQEATPQIMMDLLEHLPSYRYGDFAGHLTNSEEDLHGVGIIYRPDKVHILNFRQLKTLLHTGWYRGCLVCDFQIDGLSDIWRISSIHAKGYNPKAATPESRKDGFDEVCEVIDYIRDGLIDHFIIAGDLNEDSSQLSSENCRLDALRAAGYRTDGNSTPTEYSTDRKIDWIFYRGSRPITPVGYADQDTAASDHLLAATTI
jgi:endonuclease/exonuclease/phosphatase family metal-dependent hydrolase